MKKCVFTLLVILVTVLTVTAQTEQGDWMVGGNLGLNTTSNNSRFSFSPSAGYFAANNLAVGVTFSYDYSKVSSIKGTTLGIGPFVRYYFGAANARPFVHGEWSYVSVKAENATSSSTVNGGNYFIAAGLAAFINPNVAIEGLAGYDHSNYRHDSYPGGGGFALKIGFQVYLSGAQVSKVTTGQ